jgi:galactose mutarotase-like enzyme
MIVTLENDLYTVTFETKGAELISLINKKTNRNYIWEGDPAFWGKHSPILFPIVGTLKNDMYYHNDQPYVMPRHGFARDMEFDIHSQNSNSITFSLISNAETISKYPFEFELHLCYTLSENELTFQYNVFNKSATDMPFSIGAHPAFALRASFSNYSLAFEHQETLECFVLENDLISNTSYRIQLKDKLLPLDYATFEKDALILKKLKSKSIVLLENENPLIRIDYADFPNLGIWTKTNAPFICIEPWNGYADVIDTQSKISEKDGIQIAKPNSDHQFSFSIHILS